jgi:hypothetical protein
MHFQTSNLFFLFLQPRAETPSFQFTNTTSPSNSTHVSLDGRPILRVDVCNTAEDINCEAIETVSGECRVLTTALYVAFLPKLILHVLTNTAMAQDSAQLPCIIQRIANIPPMLSRTRRSGKDFLRTQIIS